MTKVDDCAGNLPGRVQAQDALLSQVQACYIEMLKKQLREALPVCLCETWAMMRPAMGQNLGAGLRVLLRMMW